MWLYDIPQPNLISESGLENCFPSLIAMGIERIKYKQRMNK